MTLFPGALPPVDPADRAPDPTGPRPYGGTLVLVVDDDEAARQGLIDVLGTAGITALGCGRRDEALQIQAEHHPVLAVVDYRLPDGSGLDLTRLLKERDPELPAILLTGYASIDSAIASVGELDTYLIKPVTPQTFVQAVHNALSRRNLLTENRSLLERLQRLNAYQALYDPLTGLPNRALLDDRLAHDLASCRRSGSVLAVLFVDLDTFKIVNDLFGHHVGDQLLRQMAERLGAARRSSDTVARFGGDEFVVVCPDVKTSAVACRIAQHLIDELSAPANVEGLEHQLAASVGIALSSRGALDQTPESLLRDADIAMYRAKEAGGGRWELFDESMRDRVVERFEIERALRSSVDGENLSLSYQPIVNLSTGQVAGAEALLRWHRPGFGTVMPATFLPVAEESGLSIQIGSWVLRKAVADLKDALGKGLVPSSFRMWINVSAHQLVNPRFGEQVAETMSQGGIPGSMIGLEVVEEVLRDVNTTGRVLHTLRDLGVAVSLDDFGAGTSNLSWLQELPICGLKIDRRFVSHLFMSHQEAKAEKKGAGIVKGLLGLGHALGLSVVGEGVETSAQAQALVEMGCDLAQGYYFAYPGTPDQLWAFVENSSDVFADAFLTAGNGTDPERHASA